MPDCLQRDAASGLGGCWSLGGVLLCVVVGCRGLKGLSGVWVDKDARGGVYAQFAAAVQANRDDVGLIDEHRLTETATSDGWDVPIETLIGDCGLSRVRGRLAWADTALATIKAALLELRRPATLHELCTITGLPYGVTSAAVARNASMHRIAKGVPHHAGLIAVA